MSQCKATSKSTGNRCGNKASKGLEVCYMHGARAPQAKAAAQRRIDAEKAEKAAKRFLRDHDVPVIDDPIRALTELTAEASAFYGFVRDHVANLDVEQWIGSEGALSEHVKLMERAQARAQAFLADWVRLGLEERLVRLSERQAEAIGRVIDGVLNALGMDEETLTKAKAELPRQLRLVSRGAA